MDCTGDLLRAGKALLLEPPGIATGKRLFARSGGALPDGKALLPDPTALCWTEKVFSSRRSLSEAGNCVQQRRIAERRRLEAFALGNARSSAPQAGDVD
jgi:hypothetical protein